MGRRTEKKRGQLIPLDTEWLDGDYYVYGHGLADEQIIETLCSEKDFFKDELKITGKREIWARVNPDCTGDYSWIFKPVTGPGPGHFQATEVRIAVVQAAPDATSGKACA